MIRLEGKHNTDELLHISFPDNIMNIPFHTIEDQLDDDRIPLSIAREISRGVVSQRQKEALVHISSHDFSLPWSMADPHHLEDAAIGLSFGVPVVHPFGNITAWSGHPNSESVVHSNRMKGRALDQVGSVTTIPEHFMKPFDLKKLPLEMRSGFENLVYDLYGSIGPFGIRAPAHRVLIEKYPMLVAQEDDGMNVAQMIAVGGTIPCSSNKLYKRAMEIRKYDYKEPDETNFLFFITSANISSRESGKVEAAHYYSWRAAQELGKEHGVPVLCERYVTHDVNGNNGYLKKRRQYMLDEDNNPIVDKDTELHRVHNLYSHLHRASSTSILALHNPQIINGRPHIELVRLGSADISLIRNILDRNGFGLTYDQSIKPVPMHDYEGEPRISRRMDASLKE